MASRFLFLAFACALLAAAAPDPPTCRDRWLRPFGSSSVWNSAIGSDAIFQHAQLYTGFNTSWGCALRVSAANRRVSCSAPGLNGSSPEGPCLAAGCCFVSQPRPQCFIPAGGPPDHGVHADQDILLRAKLDDPLTPFMDRAWRGGGECVEGGEVKASIPFPADWAGECEDNNNGFGLLLGDNVTLLQSQPLYRSAPGRPIMAQWPPSHPEFGFMAGWNMSILSEDGAAGGHGGSFLSSIGGTLRVGELSAGLIPHVLKLEVFGHDLCVGERSRVWSGQRRGVTLPLPTPSTLPISHFFQLLVWPSGTSRLLCMARDCLVGAEGEGGKSFSMTTYPARPVTAFPFLTPPPQ